MRVTKRTNIAFRILMFCGVHADRLVTKAEIAERCNTSESHLAQVINRLAQLGYLHTQRGRSGGITLARAMDQIDVGGVFRDLEAQAPLAECFADVDNTCPLVEACRLRQAMADAAEAFYAHLDKLTLDDLICENVALADIFTPQACAKRA
ncbi:MAG: RrF2 family transcriptional regulator [Pseudooceanicola nanhaiensis]|uniref:RrF2 family transcriptional regulator n=1 Tax=Roseovarius indicus TaxID=540747 RepID=UPI0007D918FC|nr:Rrf2 family transcriptional regulator [Roseovarius indicus]OAN99752.1 Rrf2 family transcriptional regulator [Roseovarius indicus]